MGTSWVGALARAATALGRGRRVTEGEDLDTDDEAGFTLIELMVVLLIMGILMAIAIPTFLGVTNTANDRSTQSNLTNALTSTKALYAQANGFPTTATKLVTKLTSDEPSFKFTTGASTSQNTISVAETKTATTVWLAAFMTKTKVCWQVRDIQSGTTAGVLYAYSTGTGCTAQTSFPALTTGTGTTTTANPAVTSKWPTPPNGK